MHTHFKNLVNSYTTPTSTDFMSISNDPLSCNNSLLRDHSFSSTPDLSDAQQHQTLRHFKERRGSPSSPHQIQRGKDEHGAVRERECDGVRAKGTVECEEGKMLMKGYGVWEGVPQGKAAAARY